MDTSPTYSLENGVRFGWSSLTGDLNPERVGLLESYLRGSKVLDAGCGGGAFVEMLCAQGFQTTGVDYHAAFLDVARARPNSKGTYLQGDITALPFPDKSFDCSYCFDVLEHVDDQQALRELLRVTKERLIIAVPAADPGMVGGGLTFRHYMDLTHLRVYTSNSLGSLIEAADQADFKIIPELPIDLLNVATEHLRPARGKFSVGGIPRRLYHGVLRRLLRYARYPRIYTGLVAVIEVGGDAQPRS